MKNDIEVHIRFPVKKLSSLTRILQREHVKTPDRDYVANLKKEIEVRLGAEILSGASISRIIFSGDTSWLESVEMLRIVFTVLHNSLMLATIKVDIDKIPVIIKALPHQISSQNVKILSQYNVSAILLRIGSFDLHVPETLESTQTAICLLSEYTQAISIIELWSNESNEDQKCFRANIEGILKANPSGVRYRGEDQDLISSALSCAGYLKNGEYYFDPRKNYTQLLSSAQKVLGIGAGAYSYSSDIEGKSHIDKKNPQNAEEYRQYMQELYHHYKRADLYKLINDCERYIYNAFMKEGALDLDIFHQKFGLRLESIHPGLLDVLEDLKYIQVTEKIVTLTITGQQLAANVLSNFSIQIEDLSSITGIVR